MTHDDDVFWREESKLEYRFTERWSAGLFYKYSDDRENRHSLGGGIIFRF
jgi:hypothetical protein